MELTEADLMECPCYDVSWDCKVKKVEIPMPISMGSMFSLFIGLTDRMQGIPILNAELVRNQMSARFTGKNIGTLEPMANGNAMLYLYLKSNQLEDLELIYGRGVFNDPTKVNVGTADGNGGCTTRCFDPLTDRYPMSGVTRGMVYAMIFERELKLTLAGLEDLFANSQDDDSLMKLQYMMNMNDAREDGQTQRGRPATRQTIPSQTRKR